MRRHEDIVARAERCGKHALRRHICTTCGRAIMGNAFYYHVKAEKRRAQ